MQEIRSTNERLISKIEEMESNQKCNVTTSEIMELRKTVRRYEVENTRLKVERISQEH